MTEYAYFDSIYKGNSKKAIEKLRQICDTMKAAGIEEIVVECDSEVFVAVSEPIPAIVIANRFTEAKIFLRKLLKSLGYEQKMDLDRIFKLAEEIDKMPIEEVIKKYRAEE